MPLNPKVRICDDGVHGHCWFANDDFKAGEWIWKLRAPDAPNTDIFLSRAQINALPPAQKEKWLSLAYQVDDDMMCGFDPARDPIYEELIEDYVNHCCDGNAWYEGANMLVAMRDIAKGEEIYYDYALTENHPDFVLAPKCLCGKEICRGVVTGNDWKIVELQEKYGKHFMPHAQKGVDRMVAERAAGKGQQ